MKKTLLSLIFLIAFILAGCSDVKSTDNTLKEDIDSAISEYRESLYKLGATNNDLDSNNTVFLSNFRINNISKDDIIPSPVNIGIDAEWLDMSMLVLDFSDMINNSNYILGEETIIADILSDTIIWGWPLDDTSTVILDYVDEELYLRVISETTVQTFFFSYNENDMMTIFRLDESKSSFDDSLHLYIEDFVENKGLTIWNYGGYYQLYSTYQTLDGGFYTISINNSEEINFYSAIYLIDNIDVTICWNETAESHYATVYYDLMNMTHFDEFDIDGNLYLEGELIPPLLEIRASTVLNVPFKHFVLAVKSLTSDDDILGIPEWSFESTISLADIESNFINASTEYSFDGLRYDYSQSSESIMDLLEDSLYFDYTSSENE